MNKHPTQPDEFTPPFSIRNWNKWLPSDSLFLPFCGKKTLKIIRAIFSDVLQTLHSPYEEYENTQGNNIKF